MVNAERIERFLKVMTRYGINMHTVEIYENGKSVFERSWAPFSPDIPHRMYSVTKSFVSMAIGCLIEDGIIGIDDRITDHFHDKLPENVYKWLREQTVRDMLTMSTCFGGGMYWFQPGLTDRTAYYFAQKPCRPAGTLFDYDSTGSYILGALVERLTGKKLLSYMREKFLDALGGFEDAEILETPDGTAWGDSALVCRPRSMAKLALCLMDGGKWNGKQLLPSDYVAAATSKQTETDLSGTCAHDHYGYGYQIWMTEQNGFAFVGMGGQYAICVPDKKFCFVCTGDNQINPTASETIFRAVFEELVDPNGTDAVSVCDVPVLSVCEGRTECDMARAVNGARFVCGENLMGIKEFCLTFENDTGRLDYINAQGKKTLEFGMGKNVFGYFPEFGYSDGRGNVHENTGFMLKCAASAGWTDEKKLQIKVQITDRYFGGLTVTVGFRDANTVGIRMVKAAEDFLDTYNGWAGAERI